MKMKKSRLLTLPSNHIYFRSRNCRNGNLWLGISRRKMGLSHSLDIPSAMLIRAAQDGKLDDVREHLQLGADINAKDGNGGTALMWASSEGHLDIVLELLNHPSINAFLQNHAGLTAVRIAIVKGHEEIVRCLQEHAQNRQLIRAAQDGKLPEVRNLIQEGANINATIGFGTTALILASQNGHLDIVCELLKSDNTDVNHQGEWGFTALMYAISKDHFNIVVELLKHDEVDVNRVDDIGSTALKWASFRGHVDIVIELLNREDVDVNHQSTTHSFGKTALMLASSAGHVDVVIELLKRDDVDVNLQGTSTTHFFGGTALMLASSAGHVDVVIELLKRDDVDVNLQDKLSGETAIIIATRHGHSGIERCLEEHALNYPSRNWCQRQSAFGPR
jgi:ankyrin repeat protein